MDQYLNNPNESSNNIESLTHTTSTSSILDDTAGVHSRVNAKYCADFKPIKELLNQHIEQFYKPVINLLPEDFQLILLDETRIAGLNTAACILLTTVIFVTFLIWFTFLKRQQNEQRTQTIQLNEKMLIFENNFKKLTFEKQTLESEYTRLEASCAEAQTKLTEKEKQLNQANDLIQKHSQSSNLDQKEIDKLRFIEAKLTDEINLFKVDLENLRENNQNELDNFKTHLITTKNDNEAKLKELNNKIIETEDAFELSSRQCAELQRQVTEIKHSETKLIEALEAKEKLIQTLQNSLLQLNSSSVNENSINQSECSLNETQSQSIDSLIKIAELQMEIKNVEQKLDNERSQLNLKSLEIATLGDSLAERLALIDRLEDKKKDLEKLNRDQEMQIKLLNELREKDTKQHLKALNDLDAQLKKKSNDADKISHFLDQLRVKQERIQELESQFTRVERQANQERQQFEKQIHENWLQARKIEKELKDAKLEITALKERCSEYELENKNLNENYNSMKQNIKQSMPQNNGYFMSPGYLYQQQLASSSHLSNRSNESTSPDKDKINTLNQSETNDKEADQPLQLETLIANRQGISPTPSVSSTSGATQMPFYPPYMIRPQTTTGAPYRYPFPLPSPAAYAQHTQQLNDSNDVSSSSPTPNRVMPPVIYPAAFQHMQPLSYRMNPMLFQQQQHQYFQQQFQQFQHTKSASSSQLPSPGGNTSMTYSHTYPSYLNDSTVMNRETQSNLEEAVKEAASATEETFQTVSSSAIDSNHSNSYESNLNV